MTTPGIPRPPRPCLVCTTPTTNKGGRCDIHTRQRTQQHNQQRAYYHTTAWTQLRTACLTRDHHQCVLCGSTRLLTAHHIKARKDGGTDTLTNLVTLCGGQRGCHTRIERGEQPHTGWLTQHLDATHR